MKLVLLASLLIINLTIQAQPGQQYFPPGEYYYTILDDSGLEIQFSNNKNYRICIDDVWYNSENFPTYPKPNNNKDRIQDSVSFIDFMPNEEPITTFNEPNPYSYVRVNDCHVKLLHPPSNIKIAYKSDTMFLFQQAHEVRTLKFLPGHHYFPGWSNQVLDGLPKLIGGSFINCDQQHFVISKADFDSLSLRFDSPNFNVRRHLELTIQRIENEIANKFLSAFAKVEYKTIPLEFKQKAAPYSHGHLDAQLYPTSEENVYITMMEYYMTENNCTSYKDFFTRIDLNTNKVEHWFTSKNPQKFGANTRYFKVDTFNQVIYLRMFFRSDTIGLIRECSSSALPANIMYKSYNEGKNWREDEMYTKLFNKHNFYKYEFLDEHYAMGYKFQKIKQRKENYQIDQGVYYLLFDGAIIDSFLTPNNVRFNTNYANFHFNKGLGDTAFLGSWGYNEYNYRESNPCHLYAVKKNSSWVFEVGTDGFKRSQFYRTDEPKKDYQNFNIMGKTLFFNNGFKMINSTKIIKEPYGHGMLILEHGESIFLIDTEKKSMYISFDGGTNWLYNPKPIGDYGNMLLLDINDDGMISYFNQRTFTHEFCRFSPIN